jgi:hypothetical protein
MELTRMSATYFLLAVAAVVAIVMLMVIHARLRRRNSAKLRQRFGPEYERAVQEHGSARRAEAQLADRERRMERINIRPLAPVECEHFTNQWNSLQLRFVDSPKGSVSEADDLIVLLMQTRGYPMSSFEQRAADISVDHPLVVSNYRTAHAIASRLQQEEVSTEDLRKAMIHYRALFDEMVHVSPGSALKEAA